MTNRCPGCGTPHGPSDHFCGTCGASFGVESEVESTTIPRSQLPVAPIPPPGEAYPGEGQAAGGVGAAPMTQVDPGPGNASSRRLLVVLGGVVAVVLLAVAGYVLGAWLFGPRESASVPQPALSETGPAQAPQSPASTPVEQTPSPPAPTTPAPATPTSQVPSQPAMRTSSPQIIRSTPGEACITQSGQGWGGYYPAACKMWKPSTGLITNAQLGVGPRVVICQADLGKENPVFTAKQRNTWWVWVVTDDGRMDWFPETAVSQGESGLPISGVSVCEL